MLKKIKYNTVFEKKIFEKYTLKNAQNLLKKKDQNYGETDFSVIEKNALFYINWIQFRTSVFYFKVAKCVLQP